MGSKGLKVVSNNSSSIHRLPVQGSQKQWEVESKQDVHGYETAAVFDSDGKPIDAFTSHDQHSVAIPESVLNMQGANVTHTHPNPSFGGTLSMTDVRTFAQSEWNSISAISKQGFIYRLSVGSNANKKGLLNWTKKTGKLLQKNFNKSYEAALKRATTPLKSGANKGKVKIMHPDGKAEYRNPMTPKQAASYARQYATGMYDRAYKKGVEQFGFKYEKTKSNSTK